MKGLSRKSHRFKRKKPIYRYRFFWITLGVLLLFSGLVYGLLFTSFFQVERIEVKGGEQVNAEQVKKMTFEEIPRDFFLVDTQSIFLANTSAARRRLLNSLPRLKEVTIRRSLPDGLKILVRERKPIGTFVEGQHSFLIDGRGVIFEASSTEGLVIRKEGKQDLKLGETVIDQSTMDKMLGIKTELEDFEVVEAALGSDSRLDITTGKGWEAYFALSEDWKWQVTKLKLALERKLSETEVKDLQYCDLRFGRRVYCK